MTKIIFDWKEASTAEPGKGARDETRQPQIELWSVLSKNIIWTFQMEARLVI